MSGIGAKSLDRVHAKSVLTTADIFASDVSIPRDGDLLIAAVVDTACKLTLLHSDGSNEVDVGLNNDTDLTADQGYTFTWPVKKGDTVQMVHDDAGAVVCSVTLKLDVSGNG